VSADGGPAGVAAVDPGRETVAWRRAFDGEAVSGAHVGRGPTDQWGVTVVVTASEFRPRTTRPRTPTPTGGPTGTPTATPTPPETTVLGVDAASGTVRWTSAHRGVPDAAVVGPSGEVLAGPLGDEEGQSTRPSRSPTPSSPG
jgi:hypothetical protein